MIRVFLVLFASAVLIYARENPFFSTDKSSSVSEKTLTYKYGKISLVNKIFKIYTKDKLKKKFILSKPYRMVLDFKRESDMDTKQLQNIDVAFKKITIGSHQKYYRIVVELDKKYTYKDDIITDGYIIVATQKR